MEQFSDSLKKVVKAGFGAVAAGMEKTQEVIENLSQKGEPLYEQAKSAVSDAAEKIKKAVDESGIGDAFSCRPQVQSVISDLQQMSREELEEVREAVEELLSLRKRQDEAREETEQTEETKQTEETEETDETAPADEGENG